MGEIKGGYVANVEVGKIGGNVRKVIRLSRRNA